MTRIGPRRCWCCTVDHYPVGHCVQGPRCRCSNRMQCPACRRCLDHCICATTTADRTRRYFLATDGDSHWHLVPAGRRAEWEAWADLDSDEAWTQEAPAWAIPLGGAPNRVEFCLPTMDGEPLAPTRPPSAEGSGP
jgi:hypothetical protein